MAAKVIFLEDTHTHTHTQNTHTHTRWQIFAWDEDGRVAFEGEVLCVENEANLRGGCLYGEGTITLASGTVMRGNVAERGGCICETTTQSSLLGSRVPIDTTCCNFLLKNGSMTVQWACLLFAQQSHVHRSRYHRRSFEHRSLERSFVSCWLSPPSLVTHAYTTGRPVGARWMSVLDVFNNIALAKNSRHPLSPGGSKGGNTPVCQGVPFACAGANVYHHCNALRAYNVLDAADDA